MPLNVTLLLMFLRNRFSGSKDAAKPPNCMLIQATRWIIRAVNDFIQSFLQDMKNASHTARSSNRDLAQGHTSGFLVGMMRRREPRNHPFQQPRYLQSTLTTKLLHPTQELHKINDPILAFQSLLM